MTKKRINNEHELADLLLDLGIEKFDTSVSDFPCVVCIDENNSLCAMVSIEDFYADNTIPRATRVIEWYKKYVDEGMDGGNFMLLNQARATLSGLLEPLGNIRANIESEKVAAEFRRRRRRDIIYLNKKNAGHNQKDAEAEARIETQSYDNEVIEATKAMHSIRAIYQSVEQTLNAMAGSIRIVENDMKHIQN